MENDPPGPELSAHALREWEAHVEDVLRGVAHALNNRAASVAAVVELWTEPESATGSSRALLAAEVQRLRDLEDVVRTVGAQRGPVEAFKPADAATSARAVIGLHAGLRERSITITCEAAPPVRTAKWMFVRGLVGLAAAGDHRGGAVSISVTPDAGWVVVRASGAGLKPGLTPYVGEIARAMGGEPLDDAPGFRVPSLAELRRREGR